jgi:CheY-like chemotaxis protein
MGKVILIAEDDQKNIKLIRDLLNILGCITLEATDGKEAIEIAKAKKPDLILMDIQMPVMDGIEAMKILKADADSKNIPIIALTAYAMRGDEERMLGAGYDGYMGKPIDTRDFLRIIKQYL